MSNVRWGKPDDAKLIELFRVAHNGVDPNRLDIPSVRAVQEKYWPEKKYESFAPLYRKKARKFLAARTLDGHRRSKYLDFLLSVEMRNNSLTCFFFRICCC